MNALGTRMIESKVKGEVEGIQKEISGWGDGIRQFLSNFCKSLGIGGKSDDNLSEVPSSPSSSWNGSQREKEPLADILERYDLPRGLFPANYKTYRLRATRGGDGEFLEVRMPFVMEVEFPDGTELRFNKRVTCVVGTKELLTVDGIKYHGVTWAKVQSIEVESRTKIAFRTKVRKAKKISHFQEPQVGVECSKY